MFEDENELTNKRKIQIRKTQEYLFERQKFYQNLFGKSNKNRENVLKDLAKFCRADQSTFHPDPRIHAQLEGRREVYLRIMDHLNLKSTVLWEKYGGGNHG